MKSKDRHSAATWRRLKQPAGKSAPPYPAADHV
jgi:hypothetical protein